MKPHEIRRLVIRAHRAAKAFRVAAIGANAAVETYAPASGRASRRLRDIADIAPSFASDAVSELARFDALPVTRRARRTTRDV